MTRDLLASLGDEKFVSLTTFKRNGDAVASAMWIARDGESLVAWTPADTWKVKRVARDPRVTLTASGRTGKVAENAPVFAGSAEVLRDPGEVARVEGLIKRKYGFEFRIITFVEAVISRGRKPRVALRITPASAD